MAAALAEKISGSNTEETDEVDDTTAVVLLVSLLGTKMCISLTFTVIRIYTSEIYPTSVRATGLGTCKSISSIITIAAPWINGYLPENHKSHGIFG